MDIEVVSIIKSRATTPEVRRILTEAGTRYGHLVVERRNALGNIVLRCDCGETIRLSPVQVVGGKYSRCESCDKWGRKSDLSKFLGDDIHASAMSRGGNAKDRCQNSRNKSFSRYGGRGIKFAFPTVEDYAAHVGVIALCGDFGGQVDRIDNDGHYEPGNLRIISRRDNTRNRSVTTLVDGVPLAEIAEKNGLHPLNDSSKYKMLTSRIKYRRSTSVIGMREVVEMIHDVLAHVPNPNLKNKSKFRKLEVDGVPLSKYIEMMGYGGNRAVYDAAKSMFRGGKVPVRESLDAYVMRFVGKRGISPTLH